MFVQKYKELTGRQAIEMIQEQLEEGLQKINLSSTMEHFNR